MPAGRREQIEALIGQTIGNKYRIERLVGAGGMGAVYEALHLSINKRMALKFLFRDEGIDAATVARFQREAEAASAIASDHIVQIFDAGSSDDGRPYLVMELLDGEDLRRRLKREGRLPLRVVLEIAEQLLRTLGRAHQAGIIHRDLKPDNIFICKRDDNALFVKIVDFGISKLVSQHEGTLTREGTVLGTAHYMSPEQAQAFADIDGRADLYSLGAILYEALAGRPPHLGRTYEAEMILASKTPAEDIRVHAPEVPAEVAAVIAKAIAREREQRYQTALEFWLALESAGAPARSVPPSVTPTSQPAAPLDSALADTEQLAVGTRSERLHRAVTATPEPQPKWRTLGAVGLVAGGLVAAAAALGQRGGTPATAASIQSTRSLSSAPPTLELTPASKGSAAVPVPTNAPAPPTSAKSAASRPQPKPSASARPAASNSAPPLSSSIPSPSASPPAVASAGPRAAGVAGQLELKTQGP